MNPVFLLIKLKLNKIKSIKIHVKKKIYLQSATASSKTLEHLSNGVPIFLLQTFTISPNQLNADLMTFT